MENFIDKDGNKIRIDRYKTLYKDGEVKYYYPSGEEIKLEKIGSIQKVGVRTETRNRV